MGRKQRESEGGAEEERQQYGCIGPTWRHLAVGRKQWERGGGRGVVVKIKNRYWARRNQGFARPVRVRRHIKVLLGRSESGGI